MAKIWIQNCPCPWGTTASMAANGSQSSGVFSTLGFARIVGTVYSSASLSAGCGLRIRQGSAGSANLDYEYVSALTAVSGSGFSIEVIGNCADIGLYNGADSASVVRSAFRLRPV